MKIAVYSRKSKFTGKGDSIENQIEMCKDYAFKYFDAKEENIIIYEDEGFSGGNINRPQFLKMMEDAKAKKFDILICYRLDRVSRDVADFSSTAKELNDYNIDFVSIKEQFDTSTPMGRAMMYIASVFAQLERETIAERIKDNMLQLATTGRWLGGIPPLGFESEKAIYLDAEYKERALTILSPLKKEMELVEYIYDKYLELGSIHQVRKYLMKNNYKTRNDKYYSSRALSDMLRNPAYVQATNEVPSYLENKGITVAGKDKINDRKGLLIYNKTNNKNLKNDYGEWIAAVAKHDGVLSTDKWLKVQRQLDKNSMEIPRTGTSEVGLLSGIVKCSYCKSAMNLLYGNKRKDGTAPHYYSCSLKTMSTKDKCDNKNVSGIDIEHTVISKILSLAENKDMLLQELKALDKHDNNDNDTNLLDELTSSHKRVLEEINNLVAEVSKSAIASKYILPQIEQKDKELKDLESKIKELTNKTDRTNRKTENINLVVNNIINFAGLIDRLDNRQKKFFIQTIIEKVYWDGEKGLVGIKVFTKDMEVSQFYHTSSCDCYDTGIILYEKLNTSNRFVDLPENSLGERMRKARYIKGYTAKDLADICNISKNSIYCYESGTATPGKMLKSKILDILSITKD